MLSAIRIHNRFKYVAVFGFILTLYQVCIKGKVRIIMLVVNENVYDQLTKRILFLYVCVYVLHIQIFDYVIVVLRRF